MTLPKELRAAQTRPSSSSQSPEKALAVAVMCKAFKDAKRGNKVAIGFFTYSQSPMAVWAEACGLDPEMVRVHVLSEVADAREP